MTRPSPRSPESPLHTHPKGALAWLDFPLIFASPRCWLSRTSPRASGSWHEPRVRGCSCANRRTWHQPNLAGAHATTIRVAPQTHKIFGFITQLACLKYAPLVEGSVHDQDRAQTQYSASCSTSEVNAVNQRHSLRRRIHDRPKVTQLVLPLTNLPCIDETHTFEDMQFLLRLHENMPILRNALP